MLTQLQSPAAWAQRSARRGSMTGRSSFSSARCASVLKRWAPTIRRLNKRSRASLIVDPTLLEHGQRVAGGDALQVFRRKHAGQGRSVVAAPVPRRRRVIHGEAEAVARGKLISIDVRECTAIGPTAVDTLEEDIPAHDLTRCDHASAFAPRQHDDISDSEL